MVKCQTCKKIQCDSCTCGSNYEEDEDLVLNSAQMRGELGTEVVDESLIDTAANIVEDIEDALGDRLKKRRSDYESEEDFESEETSKIYGEVYFKVENTIIDHIQMVIEDYRTQIEQYVADLAERKIQLYNVLSWIMEKENISMEYMREICYNEFNIEVEDFDDIFSIEEEVIENEG